MLEFGGNQTNLTAVRNRRYFPKPKGKKLRNRNCDNRCKSTRLHKTNLITFGGIFLVDSESKIFFLSVIDYKIKNLVLKVMGWI